MKGGQPGCSALQTPAGKLDAHHIPRGWKVCQRGCGQLAPGRGGIGADGEGSGLTSEKPRVIVEINDNTGFIPSFLSESN